VGGTLDPGGFGDSLTQSFNPRGAYSKVINSQVGLEFREAARPGAGFSFDMLKPAISPPWCSAHLGDPLLVKGCEHLGSDVEENRQAAAPTGSLLRRCRDNSSNWAADWLDKSSHAAGSSWEQEEPRNRYGQSGASREQLGLRPATAKTSAASKPPQAGAVAAPAEEEPSTSRGCERQRQETHCRQTPLPRRGRRPYAPPGGERASRGLGRGLRPLPTSRGATWSTSQRARLSGGGLYRSGLFSDRENLDQAPLDQAAALD